MRASHRNSPLMRWSVVPGRVLLRVQARDQCRRDPRPCWAPARMRSSSLRARNKPVVIRHQAPDGTIATAIVGEGLLRGRTNTLASERTASGEVSRSTTPSGTRVSRFKSTPLPGTPAAGVLSAQQDAGQARFRFVSRRRGGVGGGSGRQSRGARLGPGKKQLGGDSDDTDTL